MSLTRTILLVLALSLSFAPVRADVALPEPISDADYAPINRDLVPLGHLLFWDPILSGNRNISCASCHHPRFGTADGVSLNIGEGGIGLGPERRADPDNLPEQHIPRNAPALFNLGAREFTVLFHDGRIEVDPARPSGLRTPLEEEMVGGFDSLLSAQTMFPVLSQDEMAGHYSENDVSRAVRSGRITGPGGAWDIIARRVADIPAYQQGFAAALPEIAAGRPLDFTDISDAIAAFVEAEWRSDTSPFDRYLRGEPALSDDALRGLRLFYGDAGCASCHAGKFQTDHGFHAMAVPQFGPGKAARFERHARDTGRMRVTGRAEDAYRFRTPSLRNVTATAPYGHTGAYRDLGAFVAAHVAGGGALAAYDRAEPLMPALPGADTWRVMDDEAERAAIAAAASPMGALTGADLADILAFLGSLTDDAALQGRLGIPDAVPSGLPIDR